jgi:hypothetical protein
MNIEEEKFLLEVRSRAANNPTMARAIINSAITGMQNKAVENREHAVDMETVANMAMNTRLFKGNERFIADKLERWKHLNGLRWDDHIKKLREKAK